MRRRRARLLLGYREFCKTVFSGWFDLPSVWRDRRRIIRQPWAITARPKSFKNTPFQFAFQALFLPSTLLATLYTIAVFVLNAPDPMIDREFQYLMEIQEIVRLYDHDLMALDSSAARKEYPNLAGLSIEQLEEYQKGQVDHIKAVRAQPPSTEQKSQIADAQRRLVAAILIEDSKTVGGVHDSSNNLIRETTRNRAKIKAIRGVEAFTEGVRPITVGAVLLLNSILFASFVRRRFTRQSWTNEAQSIHLYCVGAMLAPVIFTIAAVAELGDVASRYNLNWFLQSYIFILLSLTIWALRSLWRAARLIASAAGHAQFAPVLLKPIATQLFLSYFITQISLYFILRMAALTLFSVIYNRSNH
jgi:hypothetical protein